MIPQIPPQPLLGRRLRIVPERAVSARITREPSVQRRGGQVRPIPGRLEITVPTTKGERVREYSFRPVEAPAGCVEALLLISDRLEEHTLSVLLDGRHDCTCHDFEYRSGPRGEPCKHLIAAYQTGLLTLHPIPLPATREPDVLSMPEAPPPPPSAVIDNHFAEENAW